MYDGSLWIAIKVKQLSLDSLLTWAKEYPTLLPMTLVTYALQSIGIGAVVFNTGVLALIVAVLRRIGRHVGLDFPLFAIAFVFLNSLTVYYAQSYTKEILLLLLVVCTLYGILAQKRACLGLSLLGIALVRVYFLPPFLAYLLLLAIKRRRPELSFFRWGVVLLVAGAVMGTLLVANSSIHTAAKIIQDNANTTSGIAYNYLKYIEYPIIPLLFLPVKMLQNLFEPLFSFRTSLNSDPIFIGHIMGLGAALLHMVFLLKLISQQRVVFGVRQPLFVRWPEAAKDRVRALTFLLAASLVMYSLLPFVQMRYLYPLAPAFGLLLDVLNQHQQPGKRIQLTRLKA